MSAAKQRAPRKRYSASGRAMRAACARAAVLSGDLKARDWRVLVACMVITASYSRTEDETSVGQLAQICGLSYARTSESLSRLHDAGVIVWQPTKTRRVSRVSIVGAAPNVERTLRRHLKLPLREPAPADEGKDVCPF